MNLMAAAATDAQAEYGTTTTRRALAAARTAIEAYVGRLRNALREADAGWRSARDANDLLQDENAALRSSLAQVAGERDVLTEGLEIAQVNEAQLWERLQHSRANVTRVEGERDGALDVLEHIRLGLDTYFAPRAGITGPSTLTLYKQASATLADIRARLASLGSSGRGASPQEHTSGGPWWGCECNYCASRRAVTPGAPDRSQP